MNKVNFKNRIYFTISGITYLLAEEILIQDMNLCLICIVLHLWKLMEKIQYNGMNAQLPVEGTIARGHLLTFNYDGTLEGYLKAGNTGR